MSRKYKRKKTANSNKLRSIILTTLLVSVAFLLGLWTEQNDVSFYWFKSHAQNISSQIRSISSPFKKENSSDNLAKYHFFDVGQGSSVLLEGYDGTTILIDTGRYDDSENNIINYLNEEIGVGGEIDLLIFTHNDADHIGNGDLVVEYFQVQEVWMNGMDHPSQTYGRLLDALINNEITYAEPKKGHTVEVGAFKVEVLHPLKNEQQSNQNDESIATRITIGDTSLMHSGDVDHSVEDRIVKDRLTTLQSDIIVLGHHGSSTSTGERWFQAVDPAIAVYQAGEDNHYGHPHKEIIHLFKNHPAELMGTDDFGTIQINVRENKQFEIISEEEG